VEKRQRARVERLLREMPVRVRLTSDTDDGNAQPPRSQLPKQLKAAHTWKAHVQNQAANGWQARLLVELLGRTERSGNKTRRSQQPLKGDAQAHIVID